MGTKYMSVCVLYDNDSTRLLHIVAKLERSLMFIFSKRALVFSFFKSSLPLLKLQTWHLNQHIGAITGVWRRGGG